MLKVRNLSNALVKRPIRPLYAQTQATPYAAYLDPSLRNEDGSFAAPTTDNDGALTRTVDAFLIQGGLCPGTVMVKGAGEGLLVASGADSALQPFGLLANFVGGTLDDIGDENYIGCWRGPDAVFELLAPAFDDTGLSAAYANATPGVPVKLYAGPDGRLTGTPAGSSDIVVAHLVERPSSTRIIVDLKV